MAAKIIRPDCWRKSPRVTQKEEIMEAVTIPFSPTLLTLGSVTIAIVDAGKLSAPLAKRIAACWNAVRELSTEEIEELGKDD